MKPWKLQKLVGDVIWDLRNRGLLPVAALLVVAMVVVPVMISRNGESASSSTAPAVTAISAPEATSAVVAYNPGVRNYSKRLDELVAKDPFKQHFGTPSGAGLTSQVASTITSTTTGSSASSTEISSGGTGGGGGGGKTKTKTVVQTKYLTYRMDVAFGEAGSQERSNDVEPLSFLPSEDTPVLVFLGIGGGGSKAAFLVSSDVSSVTGDGACVASSTSTCEMIVMQSGQVDDFIYTPDGKTYRLKILSIGKHFTK